MTPIALIFAAGIIVIFLGLALGASEMDFSLWGSHAEGIVISLEDEPGPHPDWQHAHVRYVAPGGRAVEFRDQDQTSYGDLNTGETVRVVFDPRDPRVASIDRGWRALVGPLTFSGIGVLLAALGVVAMRQRSREARKS